MKTILNSLCCHWEQLPLTWVRCLSRQLHLSWCSSMTEDISQKTDGLILALILRNLKSMWPYVEASLVKQQSNLTTLWNRRHSKRCKLDIWKKESTHRNAPWARKGTNISFPLLVLNARVGNGLHSTAQPGWALLVFPACGFVLPWHQGKWIIKRKACFSCLFHHLGVWCEKQFYLGANFHGNVQTTEFCVISSVY